MFTLEMRNVPLVDQPRWPALDAMATPARMAFKMVWKSTGEPVKYDDPSRHFRFIGTRASCQLEAGVEVPSIGFSGARGRVPRTWTGVVSGLTKKRGSLLEHTRLVPTRSLNLKFLR